MFNESQHIALNRILSVIKGRFVLSYNDCPFIKELYSGFSVEEISRPNNLAARYKTDGAYRELIIKNYYIFKHASGDSVTALNIFKESL